MLDFIDMQQNTDEWFEARSGKLTSSKLSVVMANYPNKFGEPAKSYASEISIERITGKKLKSHGYNNEHMRRGHEQEPIAKSFYEDEYFCDVENGGFFSSDFVGCSPDGLISDDGVIEIKSVIPSVQFKNITRKNIDPAYKWQCWGNLMFTGRKYLDFISYCDDFPEDRKIFVCRIYAKNLSSEFEMIKDRIDQFKKLVDEKSKTIKETSLFVELSK